MKDEDSTVCTNPNWTVDITIQAENGTKVTYTVFLDGKALITANMLSGYLTTRTTRSSMMSTGIP